MEQLQTNNFDLSDEGQITDYLGVHVNNNDPTTMKLTQTHLINQMAQDIGFNECTNHKDIP